MGNLFRRLAPLLLCVALVGGCASLGEVMSLQERVQAAGYRDVSVNHSTNNGFDSLNIAANGDAEADPDDIGKIVWETYPEHIDELRLQLNGKPLVATEDQLRQAFGDREITLNPDDDEAAVKRIIMWVIIGVVLFLVLIAAVIIIIVVAVRRKRRRQQPPPYAQGPGWPPQQQGRPPQQ